MVNYINTSKTMQFRVVVPANVKPGQMLRIRCPDGTEGDVRVPKGLKPGSSFIFEMPADALINKGVAASSLSSSSSASQSQQQQQQNQVNNNNESNLRQRRSVGGGGSTSNSRDGSSSTFSKGSTKGGSGGNQLQSSGFLDREILDKQDLLTALAVGILIGLSIVAGFLVGVIISTEP